MSEVKRYTFEGGEDAAKWRETPNGKWVLADDYAALERERDELLKALRSCNKAFGRINLGVLEKDVAMDTYKAQLQAQSAIKSTEGRKG